MIPSLAHASVSVAALALLGLLGPGAARPGLADIISETEPNDSYLQANPLVGNNDLGAFGTLSAEGPGGDPAEVFSFTVVTAGNVRGTHHIATPLSSPNEILVRFLDAAATALYVSPRVGEGTPGQSATWDFEFAAPGLYYASLQRGGLSIPPPSLVWDLRLQGFNTAPAGQPSNAAFVASGPGVVPEPGTALLLGTALCLHGLRAMRRRGRHP